MKVFVASDLHTEFQHSLGTTISNYCCNEATKESKVCILAGDIGLIKNHTKANTNHLYNELKKFCDFFDHVIYVHGNHEYYNHSIVEGTKDFIKRTAKKLPNLHFLNNDIIEIDGQRFVGTTLWAEIPDRENYWYYTKEFNCFSYIKDLYQNMDKEHVSAVHFLHKNLQKGDVLITHFPSTRVIVDPRFAHADTLWYYTNKYEDLVFDRQPKLCISGHTHYSYNNVVNGVRFVSNPFGYFKKEENPRFNEKLVIEI